MGTADYATTSNPRERASAIAERHRTSAARRRQRLARDQDRGASAETIIAHRRALARLDSLVEKALTRADSIELDAKFAAKAAEQDARDRVSLGRLADRVATFGAGLRRAREKAEASSATRTRDQRRRDRLLQQRMRTGRDQYFDVVDRRVDDPMELGAKRYAPFNRRVDILEEERTHRRITESQYLIGRQVQAVFERASGARLGSGGFNPCASRDQTIAHELQVIYGIEDAETVRRWVARIERQIGMVGTRFLRQILAERVTLKQYAEARGKAGDRGTAQVGGHFRILLESLDEAWQARGGTVFDPADKHDVRSAAIEQRAVQTHRRVRAARAAPEMVETDARGTVVPAGHGYRWGQSNDEAAEG